MYQGFDRDIIRWADRKFPPLRDVESDDSTVNFGSVHPNGFYIVMCDGSVRQMYYDVDEAVHRAYANRHDEKFAR
jgi:prepilin-type processing-associated H-X9-DG protein